MNETGVGGSSTAPDGSLVDETGTRIGRRRSEPGIEPLVRFSREQPLATALVALVIGYVLGKSL